MKEATDFNKQHYCCYCKDLSGITRAQFYDQLANDQTFSSQQTIDLMIIQCFFLIIKLF